MISNRKRKLLPSPIMPVLIDGMLTPNKSTSSRLRRHRWNTCAADPSSFLLWGDTAARKRKFSASRPQKLDGEQQRIVK